MKKYTIFLFLLGMAYLPARAQLNLQGGIDLVAEGRIKLVLQDMDWTNEGSFTPGSSELIVRGSSRIELGGTDPLTFFKLSLDKTSGDAILTGFVEVFDDVEMVSGNIDLNGNSMLLSGGRIVNEGAGREVFSSAAGGSVQRNITYNRPLAADSGNLGIAITYGANLGLVNLSRSHDAQYIGSGDGIKRYYQIKTANSAGSNATIRFYYNDSELNGLNETDLELFKSNDNGSTWTPVGFTTRNAQQNYVEISGVEPEGRWTLTTQSTFPVEWLDFDAWPEGGQVHCQWATASEANTHYFEVQRSMDGSAFEGLAQTPAAGNSQEIKTYDVFDTTPLMGNSYYRVKQVDLDGGFSYSPQVNVFFSPEATIRLFPNPAREVAWMDVDLIEATPIHIKIFDLNGRILHQLKQELPNGRQRMALNITGFSSGIYPVQVQTATNTYNLKLQVD